MNGTDIQWDAALRAREIERRRKEYDAISRDQQSVDGEMRELMDRTRREESQRQLDLSNVMSSAIKQSGGGPLPEVLRGFINRRYGWDGRTTGVLPGSGFQQDGSYLFRLANGADAQGSVATQDLAFGRPQIFQMMQLNRTAFNDDDRATMRGLLMKSGMSGREVSAMEFNPIPNAGRWDPDLLRNRMGGGAGGREIGSATFKGADTRPRGIHVASFDGNGGGTRIDWTPEGGRTEENFGIRDPNYKGRWSVIESGPDGKRYVNDKTGEEEFVKRDETAPLNRENATGEAALDLEKVMKAMGISSAKKTQSGDLKDRLSALSAIKSFMMSADNPTKYNADLDEQTLAQLKSAYANGIQGIASQFAPASTTQQDGGNVPTLNKDGTLTLPNGTTLRKDQEYVNPRNGYKYIWRGGSVKNFERIGGEN